jgi:predicted TIM-barrel fold metal-dependent hydrolase
MYPDKVTWTDGDRRVWEEELCGWLPARIFDAHVHVFERGSFPADYEFPARSCYRKFGCQHTLEQCLDAASEILPGVEFGMLCFGTPDAHVDRSEAARYTGSVADNTRVFGMTMVSPEDDATEIERRIREYGLVGYKPYRNFVTWKDSEAVSIPDMLPDDQMALADELGLAIMLHIPRSDRLADASNRREMVQLCERYPNAQIIFAHIGRAYYQRCVEGYLDAIRECPNAWVDTAMVNHPGVLEYTFQRFPRERILFGSDAPIAWLRGKSVEINNQYAYLMGEDYAIGTTIYDTDGVVDFTFFYYEILRGVKWAAERAGLTREELEGFFWNNAYNLIHGIAARLA